MLFVGGTGSGNYTTIQAALNAAACGDTVFVYDDSSPYRESLVVEKPVRLVGECKTTTVVAGFGDAPVLRIDAGGVHIENFTVREGAFGLTTGTSGNVFSSLNVHANAQAGIDITGRGNVVDRCEIWNNGIMGGLVLSDGNNTVSNTNFTDNGIHMYIRSLDDYRVSHACNTFRNSTVNGKPFVFIAGMRNAEIPKDAGQLVLVNCSNVTVRDLSIDRATVGIHALFCEDITVTDCVVSCNLVGVELGFCSNCTVKNARSSCNTYGIHAVAVSGCHLSGNDLFGNRYGMTHIAWNGHGNVVCHNNFIGNIVHVLQQTVTPFSHPSYLNVFFRNYYGRWPLCLPKLLPAAASVSLMDARVLVPFVKFDAFPRFFPRIRPV
jgi:parallel beta-helix repeat protein